ncbi:hypothetical protein QE373_002376 [Stenotrophomonas sp. SORGH_AS321]|nr:hypothetical protein [Stenotrophomonas sp. SORGH_AS_0321]
MGVADPAAALAQGLRRGHPAGFHWNATEGRAMFAASHSRAQAPRPVE